MLGPTCVGLAGAGVMCSTCPSRARAGAVCGLCSGPDGVGAVCSKCPGPVFTMCSVWINSGPRGKQPGLDE